MMQSVKSVGRGLELDEARTVGRIVDFLRDELVRPPRHRGYVVGLSGGIDSAVTAALTARATGTDGTVAVLLPERESQPDGVEIARDLARQLRLPCVEHDLTSTLAHMGVYEGRESVLRELFPEFAAGWTYRLSLPGDLRESQAMNAYRVEAFDPQGNRHVRRPTLEQLRRLQALTNVKQRLRMTRLYCEAESRGMLVAGTTNRTEMIGGFFVRYGDGGVDVEPIAGLYKVQVWALARHLGLPRAVIDRPPSPDTWSAPVSDQEFFFRLPYELLDPILSGIDRGDSARTLAHALGLEPELVDRVKAEAERRLRQSERLRELAPQPELACDPDSNQERP